uniref:Dehydrogenase/reductase (SDR family) X-linked n=1 Tax=Echeneis naucrates TaxID=173247 RepID=A0A665T7E9_ECHNA
MLISDLFIYLFIGKNTVPSEDLAPKHTYSNHVAEEIDFLISVRIFKDNYSCQSESKKFILFFTKLLKSCRLDVSASVKMYDYQKRYWGGENKKKKRFNVSKNHSVIAVEFVFVDLTSLQSVRQFVQAFKSRGLPLHVLVNNAGTMLVPETRTVDGFEFHFALNYLGHFLLTNLLLDVLKKSARPGCCSRIINMSSATHYAGVVDMEDLNRRVCYSSHGAYSQSKLALVLFTYYLQEQLTAGGFPVTVNAVDPGMVDTALYNNLWTLAQAMKKPVAKILFRTPAEGASTAIYVAAAAEMEGVGGCYVYNGQKTRSSDLSYDSQLQAELWKKSCELTGFREAWRASDGHR